MFGLKHTTQEFKPEPVSRKNRHKSAPNVRMPEGGAQTWRQSRRSDPTPYRIVFTSLGSPVIVPARSLLTIPEHERNQKSSPGQDTPGTSFDQVEQNDMNHAEDKPSPRHIRTLPKMAQKRRKFFKTLTKLLSSTFGLFLVVMVYMFLGALVFMALERGHEKDLVDQLNRSRFAHAEALMQNVTCLNDANCVVDWIIGWENNLWNFPIGVIDENVPELWGLSNAFFFCFTAVSTIGNRHKHSFLLNAVDHILQNSIFFCRWLLTLEEYSESFRTQHFQLRNKKQKPLIVVCPPYDLAFSFLLVNTEVSLMQVDDDYTPTHYENFAIDFYSGRKKKLCRGRVTNHIYFGSVAL